MFKAISRLFGREEKPMSTIPGFRCQGCNDRVELHQFPRGNKRKNVLLRGVGVPKEIACPSCGRSNGFPEGIPLEYA
jgi:DNA-directed RNA polymerase subunit RPC12/RpoP